MMQASTSFQVCLSLFKCIREILCFEMAADSNQCVMVSHPRLFLRSRKEDSGNESGPKQVMREAGKDNKNNKKSTLCK